MSAAAATRASAVGRPVAELETPALVVDLDRLERNLARAAEYAAAHGLDLYPHSKTHKTREIAELQLGAGAAGLTTAKSTEAEIFAVALGAPSCSITRSSEPRRSPGSRRSPAGCR